LEAATQNVAASFVLDKTLPGFESTFNFQTFQVLQPLDFPDHFALAPQLLFLIPVQVL
jgi:hypothetical protein